MLWHHVRKRTRLSPSVFFFTARTRGSLGTRLNDSPQNKRTQAVHIVVCRVPGACLHWLADNCPWPMLKQHSALAQKPLLEIHCTKDNQAKARPLVDAHMHVNTIPAGSESSRRQSMVTPLWIQSSGMNSLRDFSHCRN